MSRREGFRTSSDEVVQNNRATEYVGYCLPSQASSERHRHYQNQTENNGLSPQEFRSPLKSNRFNTAGRGQYPISQNNQAQPSNQTWPRTAAFSPQQAGRGRYPSTPYPGNGYSNLNAPSQPQLQPNQTANHPSQRRGTNARPQVHLPRSNPQTPSKKDNKHPTNDVSQTPSPSTAVESRSNPQKLNQNSNTKPIPSSFRRHRHSTSGSSKASTGSNPWSQATPTKTLTQPSSPDPSSDQNTSAPLPPLEDLHIQDNDEDEWLLLRKETLEKPRPQIRRDKYAHLHPIVRKYASQTIPELKMGEPRWANAVMSRRWEREETLEQDKKAYQENGPTPPIHTCMTERQAKAYALAQETLALLKELDSDTEKDKK